MNTLNDPNTPQTGVSLHLTSSLVPCLSCFTMFTLTQPLLSVGQMLRLFRWSRVGFFLQGAAGKKGIKGAKGKKVILPVDSLMMMKPPCHFLFPAGICSLMRLFLFFFSSSLSSSREAEVTVETKDRLFLHFHFSTFTSQRYKNNRFLERKWKMCLWCWGGLTDLKTHFVWKICDVTQNL